MATNTSGLSPLQATPPTKSCLADFTSLTDLYEDIAAHMFFSPAAAQATKGDTGLTGATGATGADGPIGPAGPTGADGLSAYQVWLTTQTDKTQTEAQYLASLIGATGPAPTASKKSTVALGSGATSASVLGTPGTHFFSVVYDNGTTGPATPPNNPGIGPLVDLGNGYTEVHLTAATGDGNFKLCSAGFE